MRRTRFFLSIFFACSLLIGLPSASPWFSKRPANRVLAATGTLADGIEGQVVSLTHQDGQAPDQLFFWSLDDTAQPISTKEVTGLVPGEKIGGIDYDPETEKIIGVTNLGNVVAIDPSTGVAVQIARLSSTFAQGQLGVDYDPDAKVLRLMSENGFQAEIDFSRNPPFIILDTTPTYPADDANASKPPKLAGLSSNQIPDDNSRRLYAIDSAQDVLARLEGFRLKTIGGLGVNTGAVVGFSAVPNTPNAIAALQLEGEQTSKLYLVSLLTGAVSEIGLLGDGRPIAGLALLLKQKVDNVICEIDPPEDRNPVGTDHSFKITVKRDGKLVPAFVMVGIFAGPNIGVNGTGKTKDNPDTEEKEIEAGFTYTSNGKTGIDTINVGAITIFGEFVFCTAKKEWFVPDDGPPNPGLTISTVTLNGKKLTVTGCCFAAGDKIFVNDKEQATKIGPNNSTTILIAKKGGKKIKACEAGFTNRVFVRRNEIGKPVQDTAAFATCP